MTITFVEIAGDEDVVADATGIGADTRHLRAMLKVPGTVTTPAECHITFESDNAYTTDIAKKMINAAYLAGQRGLPLRLTVNGQEYLTPTNAKKAADPRA